MSSSPLQVEPTATFQAEVQITRRKGFTPEEVAERCAQTIIDISDEANPAIRAQAHAFRGQVLKTLEFYIREAVQSDRTTVYNALTDAGHPELANHIRRL
jgi:hypothetical protein